MTKTKETSCVLRPALPPDIPRAVIRAHCAAVVAAIRRLAERGHTERQRQWQHPVAGG